MSVTLSHYTIAVGANPRLTPADHRREIVRLLALTELDATVTESHGYTTKWGHEIGHVITLYGADHESAYNLAWKVRDALDQDEVWLVRHTHVDVTPVRRGVTG